MSDTTIDHDLRRRCVERFAGNKDRQGVGALSRAGAFCVMGVICDEIDPTGWSLAPDREDGLRIFHGHSWGLSYEAQLLTGLTGQDCCKLMEMNDGDDATFPEIAAHLRDLWGMEKP